MISWSITVIRPSFDISSNVTEVTRTCSASSTSNFRSFDLVFSKWAAIFDYIFSIGMKHISSSTPSFDYFRSTLRQSSGRPSPIALLLRFSDLQRHSAWYNLSWGLLYKRAFGKMTTLSFHAHPASKSTIQPMKPLSYVSASRIVQHRSVPRSSAYGPHCRVWTKFTQWPWLRMDLTVTRSTTTSYCS